MRLGIMRWEVGLGGDRFAEYGIDRRGLEARVIFLCFFLRIASRYR
jgi:hypothetical protein